jgi:tetratricopeptide (TPR) repeat protein
MSKKHNQEVDTNIESLSKAEAFVTKHNKKIIAAILAIVAIAAGILIWKHFDQKKAKEAQEAFTQVENTGLMAMPGDSLTNAISLNEFEQYMNHYGDKAVSIAPFEAGVAAYETKNYEKALEYFSQYKGSDPIYKARALYCIAVCHIELGSYQQAYDNLAIAVATADNELAAEYAFLAGIVAEKLGKKDKALSMYELIKNKYPRSPRYQGIDKYISRVAAK